jgi:hypothetical protein
MRDFERVHDVDGGTECLLERQRTADGRSLEVLHHQIVRTDVVEDADMRMVQRRDRARFLEKTRGVNAVERLDGHCPAQAGVEGLVDLAHATCTHHGHDFKRTEAGTRGQRHRKGRLYFALRRVLFVRRVFEIRVNGTLAGIQTCAR